MGVRKEIEPVFEKGSESVCCGACTDLGSIVKRTLAFRLTEEGIESSNVR